MAPMLTVRSLGISGSGSVIGSEPYRYEVVGLPAGRGAMLARLSGVWKILKIEPGKYCAWTGSFVSAEMHSPHLRAMSRLQTESVPTLPFDRPMV
jgi:hypothetical protein